MSIPPVNQVAPISKYSNGKMSEAGTMRGGGEGTLNANTYATKKSFAQGLLDLALLTSNISQLKYVIKQGSEKHEYFVLMLVLIGISILLQVLVAVAIVIVSALNIGKLQQQPAAKIVNDLITLTVFFISVINIVISSFGMKDSDKV